jgi:hypothetical protein
VKKKQNCSQIKGFAKISVQEHKMFETTKGFFKIKELMKEPIYPKNLDRENENKHNNSVDYLF